MWRTFGERSHGVVSYATRAVAGHAWHANRQRRTPPDLYGAIIFIAMTWRIAPGRRMLPGAYHRVEKRHLRGAPDNDRCRDSCRCLSCIKGRMGAPSLFSPPLSPILPMPTAITDTRSAVRACLWSMLVWIFGSFSKGAPRSRRFTLRSHRDGSGSWLQLS